MGQRLREDKIPTLTQNAGTITMPSGARLTIGGQQYVTASALTVATDLSAACTRYQVFAVVNAGVVSLVVSANENSAGPAGYNAWKLVGSYYTNGLSPVSFGAFVNISGVPSSEWFNAGATIVRDVTEVENGAVSTAPLDDFWIVKREGKNLIFSWNYYTTSNAGAVAGSTAYYIFWPRNFPYRMDIDLQTYTVSTGRQPAGWCRFTFNNVVYDESNYCFYVRPWGVSIVESDNVLDSGKFPLNVVTTNYGITVRDTVPIDEWNETPIEDL